MPKGNKKEVSWNIYIDGASRGNPGPAASAVVIEKDGEVAIEKGYYLGYATNNVAEYTAFIKALELGKDLLKKKSGKAKIYSDSELLVKHMKGEYRIKDRNLKALFEKARELSKEVIGFELSYVPREKNKVADSLCNRVLNLQEDI